jgi:hypothetical protein
MIQSIDSKKVLFLEPYEEIVGTIDELSFFEGLLIGRFGTIMIAIPHDMENRIRPFIGKKLGLLRTDLPAKPYLFRLLDQENATISEGSISQ